MDDEHKAPESDGNDTTEEASEQPVYRLSTSFIRRCSQWPETFGRQMDNKLYSPRSSGRFIDAPALGSTENSSDSPRGFIAGADSPLTEPLLRKVSEEKTVFSRRRSFVGFREDLETGCRVNGTSGGSDLLDGDQNGAVDLLLRKEEEEAVPSGSSFLQATFNGMNVLAGVGLLSTPYALSEGGWISMGFLLLFAMMCFYTGVLLRRCLDTDATVITYPDIGQAAYGWKGRLLVSVLLYFELYCVTVEFLILEGDNLSSLFPFAGVSVGYFKFTQLQVYIVISALCMLPTLWLRDLSILAYVSAGGVIASVAIVSTVGYVGAFDGIGFHHRGRLVDPSGLPVAVGVYAFCFCGHAVFPSIYRSMERRQDFSKVLLVCFILVTVMYAGIGALGYTMFGDQLESQVTLNLPKDFLSSRVAIWITLVIPYTKFALTITPLAVALEEFLPWTPKSRQFLMCGNIIRTLLVVSLVVVALLVPFFGYLMAFIGSFMSVSVAIILPCLCYLKIFSRRGGISSGEYSLLLVMVCVGVVTAFVGTYSAIKGIIGSFDDLR